MSMPEDGASKIKKDGTPSLEADEKKAPGCGSERRGRCEERERSVNQAVRGGKRDRMHEEEGGNC
jgi:hypothetical protein